ncbi:alpha/beta hydrolase [Sphingomonas sp.]|uniref:alpha/beta fold hydrolase n=1 Tax=Sphingomonas sp. TaxID=28214 RepID=UPI00286AAA65|nr:alpha/beta hydrolase [Sphingomonas sp.]
MTTGHGDICHFGWGDNQLAYRRRPGTAPTLVFLPGYASDMDGAKAIALDAMAEHRGCAMLRFDYSGTGASSGAFENGTLAGWLDEALALVDQFADGPVIAIGSSMGAWIALHLALRRPDRMQALVGIAAAPDFTDWGFTAEQKKEVQEHGQIARPNPYGAEPQVTTRALWESGQALRLLRAPIAIDCPVRLIHGDADRDVPIAVANRLMRQLRSADVQLNILKDGGHRLSEPREIAAIVRTVEALLEPDA